KIIYLLDGNAFFPLFLNLFNTPVKENLLIIGIGYDNNLAFDTQKRTKDYTPTTNLNKQGGGSKEFRNFLITQLIPYINKMYPIDFSHQILFGHSFGGLFAIDTLLYDSKIFSHYFIISPSLWWDNSEFLPNIIKLQTCPKIYIGLGSLETNSSIIKGVTKLNAQKLSEKISKETNCKTHFKLFKNETHGSVISKAMLWMKKLLDLN
ncbi:alpha/beta hydrolase, partial [Campylobacter jejuni]